MKVGERWFGTQGKKTMMDADELRMMNTDMSP